MKNLDEHNAEKAAADQENSNKPRAVGVACPQCKPEVEMVEFEPGWTWSGSHSGKRVICPMCGHSGVMR